MAHIDAQRMIIDRGDIMGFAQHLHSEIFILDTFIKVNINPQDAEAAVTISTVLTSVVRPSRSAE
jgi:hypothetical protein